MTKRATALILSILLCFNSAFLTSYAEEIPGTEEPLETVTEETETESAEIPQEESASTEESVTQDTQEEHSDVPAESEDSLGEELSAVTEEGQTEEYEPESPAMEEELPGEPEETGEMEAPETEEPEHAEPEGELQEESEEEFTEVPEYSHPGPVIGFEESDRSELEALLPDEPYEISDLDEEAILLGTSDITYEEAKARVTAAQKAVSDAQAQIDKGSYGFFEDQSATEAMAMLDLMQSDKIEEGRRIVLGNKEDPSDLELMKVSIDMIEIGNKLRTTDDNFPGLQDLRINNSLMALAQANAAHQRSTTEHWSVEDGGISKFNSKWYAGENIAWGYKLPSETSTAAYGNSGVLKSQMSAYSDWYAAEKKNFEEDNGHETGHYSNIVDDFYRNTGFAIGYGDISYGTRTWHMATYTQEFDNDMLYSALSDKRSYTVDEYRALFMNYYNRVMNAKTTAERELAEAQIVLDSFTGISLSDTSLTLKPGETKKLNTVLTPSDTSDRNVEWSSSNTAVAAVGSDGTVTAKSGGTATITVTHVSSGKTASCRVTVPVSVTGVTLNKTSLTLTKGKSETLKATVSPAGVSDKTVTWSSSNASVASVDSNGKVTARAGGTATITVKTTEGNKSAVCTVKVTEHIPVTSIAFDPDLKKYLDGYAVTKSAYLGIFVDVLPENASNRKYRLESSDPSVVAVEDTHTLFMCSPGEAVITAIADDNGMKTSVKVRVVPQIKSISLNKQSLAMNPGNQKTLTVSVNPKKSASAVKYYKWTSSNEKVATVDKNGKITAKGKGTATITATTNNGLYSATCKVTVKEIKPVPTKDPAACRTFGFCRYNGKDYWYENGVRQAVAGDPKNLIDEKYHVERGREIFDPETKAWYWLDSCFDGAKAVGKEVWMPYIYQDEKNWKNDTKRMNDTVQAINSYSEAGGPTSDMGEQVRRSIQKGIGKWVRYDENGRMMKGWVTINTRELIALYPRQKGNTYFYDYTTGLMAKGWTTIGGRRYHFDEITGVRD